MGLPVVGESLAFAKNPFAFVARRLARYGRVFKTHILSARTAVMAGPGAAGRFADADLVMRAGAMPGHVADLWAGENLAAMDGPRHRTRKQLVLAAFTPDALAAYLPDLRLLVERRLAGWAGRGEIRALDGLESLSFECICTNILGLESGPAADTLAADYRRVARAFTAIPLRLPWTRLGRALAARDRVLATLAALVAERRSAPRADGLSRILAATADDGTRISDDEAVREMHHLVLAGYIIYAELAGIVVALARDPDLAARLRAEAAGLDGVADSRGPHAALPLLERFVMEVKRVTPIIPGLFARAARSFEHEGTLVPQGWTLLLATFGSMQDPTCFAQPDTFDPDRFAEGRAEHLRQAHAFVPHGVGPPTGHYCAGADYATLLMSAFAVASVAGYDWALPTPPAALNWRVIPPAYTDGLRAVVMARGA